MISFKFGVESSTRCSSFHIMTEESAHSSSGGEEEDRKCQESLLPSPRGRRRFGCFGLALSEPKTAETPSTLAHSVSRLHLANCGTAATALWVNWGSGCLIPVKIGVKSNNHSALNGEEGGTDYDGWSVGWEESRLSPLLQCARTRARTRAFHAP